MTWWISSPFFSSIISLLFFFFFFSQRNLFTNNNSLLTLLFQSGDKSVTIQVFTLYAKKIRWTDKVNIFFSRIPRLPRFTFRRQVQINLDAIVEIELISWKKKKNVFAIKKKKKVNEIGRGSISRNKFSKQIRKISRLFLPDIYVVYEIFSRYLRRASVDRRKDLKTMQIIFRLRHLKVRPGYFFPDISSIEFVRYFCTWECKNWSKSFFFFFSFKSLVSRVNRIVLAFDEINILVFILDRKIILCS